MLTQSLAQSSVFELWSKVGHLILSHLSEAGTAGGVAGAGRSAPDVGCGQEASFPCHLDPSMGLLQCSDGSWLPPEWWKRNKEDAAVSFRT